MSDTFIPPAVSEAGAALRSTFNTAAIETALAAWIAEHSGIEVFPGSLPDEFDGIRVAIHELPEPQEPFLGRRHAVVICSGHSPAAEFFARISTLIAHFPAAGQDANGIRFHQIQQKGSCRFAELLHHGIRKHSAELTLLCEIDLTQSTFSPTSQPEPVTPAMWSALRPAIVEAALAVHLGSRPGALQREEIGSSVRIIGGQSLTDPTWRDFELEVAVRALGASDATQTLSRLLSNFPVENFSIDGTCFNAVWMERAIAVSPETLLDRASTFAAARLIARVNTANSQDAGGLPTLLPPNRNVASFDPVALERSLSERIAHALGLSIDRELCRGDFPPPGCGVQPVAAVRLTGVASGNQENGWRIQAQLQLRAPHRDDLFRRILAFDALFPLYDESLGSFTIRAILKREFKLNWDEQNGRNIIFATLSFELIL